MGEAGTPPLSVCLTNRKANFLCVLEPNILKFIPALESTPPVSSHWHLALYSSNGALPLPYPRWGPRHAGCFVAPLELRVLFQLTSLLRPGSLNGIQCLPFRSAASLIFLLHPSLKHKAGPYPSCCCTDGETEATAGWQELALSGTRSAHSTRVWLGCVHRRLRSLAPQFQALPNMSESLPHGRGEEGKGGAVTVVGAQTTVLENSAPT